MAERIWQDFISSKKLGENSPPNLPKRHSSIPPNRKLIEQVRVNVVWETVIKSWNCDWSRREKNWLKTIEQNGLGRNDWNSLKIKSCEVKHSSCSCYATFQFVWIGIPLIQWISRNFTGLQLFSIGLIALALKWVPNSSTLRTPTLPWSAPGCRTGNEGKLSNSWFDGLTWLCLAAA